MVIDDNQSSNQKSESLASEKIIPSEDGNMNCLVSHCWIAKNATKTRPLLIFIQSHRAPSTLMLFVHRLLMQNANLATIFRKYVFRQCFPANKFSQSFIFKFSFKCSHAILTSSQI